MAPFRKRLGEVLTFIGEMEKKYGLRCPNVFHAGDGNLHPLILFDANNADELRRTELFAAEVLEKCVAVGGTITGEHGVGVEKVNQMCVQFGAGELEVFRREARLRPARPAQPRQGRFPRSRAAPSTAACGARRRAAAPRARALLIEQFAETIRESAARGRALRLRGGGTKDFYGNALRGEVLDTRSYAGIVDYEPTELVVTARCGTPLADLESTLEANGQCLLRAAAFRRGRDARRLHRGRPVGPRRATPARCATSCSA